MLPPETEVEVKRLFYAEHLTMNTIANKLNIHHDTVKAVIRVERFHPRLVFRSSQLDPYIPFIKQTLEEIPNLRATRLFQMLQSRGYRGSVQQLRRRVSELRPKKARAYLPQTVFAGEQAQVDWGHFGTITIGKAVRRLSCFVMVLSYSRFLYARFVLDQSMENFQQCHIEGFRYFTGVPRQIRYDNLKSAVIERYGQAIRYNPALLELAGHYHFKPSACNPYSGHEKGRVERNIRYIRDNFFAGRHFSSLDDANQQMSTWLSEVCNIRPWPDDKTRRVIDVWNDEKDRLLTLPENAYGIEHPKPTKSGKLPYIRFDLNDYSIPYKLVQKPLSLVASEKIIRIFDGQTEVAHHERSYDKDQRIKNPDHFSGLYEQNPSSLMNDGRALVVGAIPDAARLYEMMIAQGIPLGASTRTLLGLIETYGTNAVRDAIRETIKNGIARPSYVGQRLAKRSQDDSQPPPVRIILPDRSDVRDLNVTQHDLAAYDQLLSEDESHGDKV